MGNQLKYYMELKEFSIEKLYQQLPLLIELKRLQKIINNITIPVFCEQAALAFVLKENINNIFPSSKRY